MPARFYVPDLAAATAAARLPADEAHHLAKVLRLTVGDVVQVFDGRGAEWRARVAAAGRDGVVVSLLDPVAVTIPRVAVTLAQSVLKGPAMDDAVRDCTMVGVAAIQPVLASRTTVKIDVARKGPARWRRVALAAAKQCGAARLPEIREVVTLDVLLEHGHATDAYILLEPGARDTTVVTARQLAAGPAPSTALLLVGPEGGWTVDERDAAIARGWKPLSLGRMILRADAVALASTATLLALWDDSSDD